MEKITDKIAALPQEANYFSLEFFPPKTPMVGFPSSYPSSLACDFFCRVRTTFANMFG
jgi:hypothetical protein